MRICRRIRAILPGLPESGGTYEIEENRVAAFEKTLCRAGAGDTVAIAGKGHARYQEIRGARHLFDERAVVREAADKIRREKAPDNSIM